MVTTCLDSRGVKRDYHPVRSDGLRSKISGIFSTTSPEKYREKLELLLRPFIQANSHFFTDLPASVFTNGREASHWLTRSNTDISNRIDEGPRRISPDHRPPMRGVTCIYWYEGHCMKNDENCKFDHCMTDWLSVRNGGSPIPMPQSR